MAVRDDIRAQYHAVLAQWTRPCQVQRFVATTDDTGREAGAFQAVAVDEPIWIQPISAGDATVEEKGLDSRTTHLAFLRWNGFELEPLDKIYDTDETSITREYDVIRAHLKESHRVAELMLPKRDPT
jgi:hypothetical protein